MGINWKVRIKNQAFWVAFIPAVLLLVKTVAAVFGFNFDFTTISSQLLDVVEAAFMVLVLLGVVVDPTTKGVGDSERALEYEEPQ